MIVAICTVTHDEARYLSDTEIGSMAKVVSGSPAVCRRAVRGRPAVNISAETTVIEAGELLRKALGSSGKRIGR